MKQILILLTIIAFVFPAVKAQTNTNKPASTMTSNKLDIEEHDTTTDAKRIIQINPGTSLDTIITISTTPVQLSSFIDTLNLSFIYLYNNTSGATLYIGGSAGVLTSGVPVEYQGSFTDNIGFYKSTNDMWLVATASTNVRIKLKYR